MKIALKFTYDTDIVSVPEDIGSHIKRYQERFDKWLYDKDNDHGYWVVQEGKRVAVSFDAQAFVDYLNTVWLQDREEKAVILQEGEKNIPTGMPLLYF